MPEIFVGDCRELLRDLPDECIDAIVTDPPYELGFMGKRWDASGIAYDVNVWRECLRVLKPGGHLLAFGGTRTYHRMTCAIEDAGFEIRDSLHWIYGSGFPKSMNVEKSGAGEAWRGWGTALKPAHEPIVVARKPLVGTVAANVLEYGTGALNIDGTRVEYANPEDFAKLAAGVQAIKERGGVMGNSWKNSSDLSGANDASTIGRWPPNVLLSHSPECGDECAEDCAVAEMDRQSGTLKSGLLRAGTKRSDAAKKVFSGGGSFNPGAVAALRDFGGDSGGASRFFPCFHYGTKASRKEREAGCENLPPRSGAQAVEREEGSDGMNSPRAGAGRTASEVRNHHPTVKSVSVMRWLVKLVTPPNGTVLDPFAGSGTTGVACVHEGFDFVGFEQSAEYAAIAEARIAHAQRTK